MAAVLEKPDIYLPSDGRKWEFVDGEARLVPTGFEHDAIAGLVYRLLFDSATQHGVLTAFGFTQFARLPRGERLPGGHLEFAPDLCVEVISRSETLIERERKLSDYFASGARFVWELFPASKTIQVHELGKDTPRTLTETDTLDAGTLLPEFSCHVADCFAIPGWPQREQP